jgi:hypothetical protein
MWRDVFASTVSCSALYKCMQTFKVVKLFFKHPVYSFEDTFSKQNIVP